MAISTPDGISSEAAQPGPRRANPIPLVLLAALMIAGLTGLLGGYPDRAHRTQSESVDLSVTTPDTLRNGMVFETVVKVRSRQPVKKLVVGISDNLWREMTINTMIPAAEAEDNRDGFHRFTFAELKAGDTLSLKLDGQINPPLGGVARGEIVALDGEKRLAAIAVHTRVLP